MRLSSEQYAEALHELLQKGNVSEVLQRFRGYLMRKGELQRLASVLELVLAREEERQGQVRLIITTKYPLNQEQRNSLESKAKALYPGKTPAIDYAIDEKVVGGFQIRGRDTLYDATLGHTLKQFSQALKS